MVIKPTPPSPPKSSAPGKKIPKSQEKLDARDRVPETEETKTGAPGASEESQEKEAKGGKKEGEEKEGEDGKEEGGEEEEGTDEDEDKDEEEEEENESEIEIAESVKKYSNLLSPEAVVFLPLAILLDLISIVLIFFGLDDFYILDIIGIPTIGMWVFYKTGFTPPAPESTGQKAEKIAKKAGEAAEKAKKLAAKAGKYGRWLRPILCMLGEVINYIGWIPFWTYLVYKTLTDDT